MKTIILLEVSGTKSSVEVERLDKDVVCALIQATDVLARDCGNNLTLWSSADKTGLEINKVASSIYFDATEFVEEIYGDVLMTGKATANEILGVSADDSVA
jgi:hypothetical protein